ncbi:hypothetical protein JOM56_000857 [Amanita muscaria]
MQILYLNPYHSPPAQLIKALAQHCKMPITLLKFSISGSARIVNIGQQHNRSSTSQDLEKLDKTISFSAFHDSSAQDPERRCHPDTREGVLDQIRDWANDPNRPGCILWLHGPSENQPSHRRSLTRTEKGSSNFHQENGNFHSGHSSHFGKWSERSERPALERSRTAHLRSVKMLEERFDPFQSRLSALKAPFKAVSRIGLGP